MEIKMSKDIGKPVMMTWPETKEISTTKKKDIAQLAKTFTKIINFRILSTLVKFKIGNKTKNMKIGNPESIEVKFKVKLLNIQTSSLKINHHHLQNLNSSRKIVNPKTRKTNSTKTGWKFIIKWTKNTKLNFDKLMKQLPKECVFIRLNTKRN